MANFTPNINLQKDLTTEVYDVGVVNANSDKIDTAIGKLNNNVDLLKDPTGFTNNDAITVTYDSTNRTVTLTGTFEAYFKGTLIPELTNGWVSDPHPTTLDKTYFLKYDGTNFVFDDNAWTFDLLQICLVQYGTNDKITLKETHGFMEHSCHQEFHSTIGAYKTAGGDLTALSYALNSTTAADRRPLVNATTMYDEDLKHVVTALTTESYTQRYLDGAGAVRTFVKSALDIIPVVGATPYYNQFTGGAWQQTPMTNNNYACVWLKVIPTTSDTGSQEYRYVWVQPQSMSTSLATIQALTPSDLVLGDNSLLIPEFIFTTKVIIFMTGNNWQIQEVQKLTGNKYSQVGSPASNYLSTVATDTSLTGDGTALNPLTVVGKLNLDQTTPQAVINGSPIMEGVQFDITPSTTNESVGLMRWNVDDSTLDVGLPNGITGQMFQEMFYDGMNATGSSIPNGTPIMFAAPIGMSGKVEIQKAIANGTIQSEYIMGIATETIANGEFGKITCFGKVRGINTTGTPYSQTWLQGDLIYVGSTAGSLTNVEPSAPNQKILVASVITVSATVGTLLVRSTWATKFTDLEDVNGPALTETGQIPVWDNTNKFFDFTQNINDKASITGVETLTNKTLTSPKINENVVMTASSTELNVLDGIPSTLTATELGYVDGVTSSIQTQLNAKVVTAGDTFEGVMVAQTNTSYTTRQIRNVIESTADASGGSNGDIWIKYTP